MSEVAATKTEIERLIESARLSGRLDALTELRDWLDARMEEAREQHEQLKEEKQ